MNDFRKLLIMGINQALKDSVFSLDENEKRSGHIFTDIAGKPSVVLFEDIGHGELRISVWWDYDHSAHPQANLVGNSRENFRTSSPLAKRAKYSRFVGMVASGWLERKTGKYIQGTGSEGIFETYARRGSREIIRAAPDPIPHGYEAEGRFHM